MKKKKISDQIDPLLRHVLDFDDRPANPYPNDPADPTADFFFREQWGIDRPGSANSVPAKKVLSREEIAESLQNLSKVLGRPGFRNTHELIAKLAKAAESHLEEGNPVREWLIAYSKGDQQAMRGAVKKLVAASRTEIVEYARRAKDPQMKIGAPGSTVKKGGWTFVYDEHGSLRKCYEGDEEPLIFAN